MKVQEVMTPKVIRIGREESADVAARALQRYNVGALPVCDAEGKLCGMITDRDLVTRCVAAGLNPAKTSVGEIMTSGVISVSPEMETGTAAALMARRQVRRLPVVNQGKVCGMLSLADLGRNEESAPDAADALAQIASNVVHW